MATIENITKDLSRGIYNSPTDKSLDPVKIYKVDRALMRELQHAGDPTKKDITPAQIVHFLIETQLRHNGSLMTADDIKTPLEKAILSTVFKFAVKQNKMVPETRDYVQLHTGLSQEILAQFAEEYSKRYRKTTADKSSEKQKRTKTSVL